MNITDPRFRYIPSSSHSDPSRFAKRQKARMKEAATALEAKAANVTPIKTQKRK